MEILIALIERSGQVVSQGELMSVVWPNTKVEEINLRVHIASLRKVLGDGQNGMRYILNSAGRGYTFVAPLVRVAPTEVRQPAAAASEYGDLPTRVTRLIGRAEVVETITHQLQRQRLVTIVGPGGIGKTTVALAVAEKMKERYANGARFVDLSPVAEPRLVPTVVASVLGLSIASDDPTRSIVRFLANKSMLIVFDTCEHVIDHAAILVDELLRSAPGVHILATSREPLRTNGEWIRRLPPLPVPAESPDLDAASVLGFPAVQLFVERVQASVDTFSLSDRDVLLAADICRRLDGMPLAIELAAGRVEQFGLAGLLDRLSDRFALLKDRMRTAHPRHRTLRATLDWSYNILSENEQLVLRRIAPFKGEFVAESAAAMVAERDLSGRDVIELLASLAGRSLVVANVNGDVPTYRLLDVNRAYALDKLSESDDSSWIFRRHCEHCCALLEHMTVDRKQGGTPEQLSFCHRIIGDVRAALDWAFSPDGDVRLGITLTIAAVPLWFRLSLIDECRARLERAINALSQEERNTSREAMQLFAALGSALMNTSSVGPDMNAIWTTVLKIAEELDDFDYRLRAHWGLWVDCCNQGRYADALKIAQGFWSVAAGSSDPVDLAVSHRWIGVTLHYMGDQSAARQHFERTLSYASLGEGGSDSMRFQYHQGAAARCYLGQIAMLQGFPDRAMNIVDRNVAHALSINHELTLCFALAEGGCPVALQVDNLEAADRFIPMLLDLAERRALTGWHAMGRVFSARLIARRGDIDAAIPIFRFALDDLRTSHIAPRFTSTLGYYADLLGRAGDVTAAHAAIDEALQRSDRNGERWCIAELLRIKGDIVRGESHPTALEEAEVYYLRSLDWARRQETLLWELRTAVSFAELRQRQERRIEGRDILMPVYQRFNEGFGSGDLRTAKNLLNVLS